MKKYIVIALYVGANSGKILNSGDIVAPDAWDKGRAEDLEDQGFIKEYTGELEVGENAKLIEAEKAKSEEAETPTADAPDTKTESPKTTTKK